MSPPGRPKGEYRSAKHDAAPASGQWRARRAARWAFALWAVLLLVLQLQGLGDAALFDVDEGAFAEATREMLASGDWGHTTLNGEPRFDKPILTYWLQAASVALFGLNEWALRLPSALATWGWSLAVAAFAWQRWGLRAGLAAGSVLATCAGVMLIGRAATADALLNLWLALATLDLWRSLEQQGQSGATVPPAAPAASPRRWHQALHHAACHPLRRCAVWIALGLLTKGPVALLVPGATLLLWLATQALASGLTGAGGRFARRLRPLLTDVPAWALLLGITLPWYAYALQRHGMAFVDGFLWRHNLQRYGGTLEGHAGAWFYYLLLLPLLLFPWSALLLPVLARWRAAWRLPLPRFLLIWAGFVLVFFSGSGTKLPHYLLYGFTPLALLAGQALVRGARSGPAHRRARLWRLTQALLVLSLCAWPLLGIGLTELARATVRAQDPAGGLVLYQALLGGPSPTWLLWLAAAGIGALAGALCLRPAAGPDLRGAGSRTAPPSRTSPSSRTSRTAAGGWVARAAAAAALGVLFHAQGLLPWWADRLQAPVQVLARQARQDAEPVAVVQWGVHLPSFAVYLGRPSPRRAPQPGELALVRSDQLPALAADALGPAYAGSPRAAWALLRSQRGLSLIRWLGAGPAGASSPARSPALSPMLSPGLDGPVAPVQSAQGDGAAQTRLLVCPRAHRGART